MKVVLLGDTHLGAGFSFGYPDPVTGINTRLIEYENTIANAVTYAIENDVAIFIFLGDIFEVRSPSSPAIVAFYRQLKRLSAAGITTYVLAGNHDQSKHRIITTSLDPLKELNIPNVHVFTELQLKVFAKNDEYINVLLIPYANRQHYDVSTNEEAIMQMRSDIDTMLLSRNASGPTLAAAHMMFEHTIASDAGEYAEMSNELILPFSMFENMDCTIAGHIHRGGILSKSPLILYSGSMECRDFSEKDHKKSFIVYDTTKRGIDALTLIPIRAKRFVEFDIDYGINMPDNIMDDIIQRINKEDVKGAVVRMIVRVPETKSSAVDTTIIRKYFNELCVSSIADINVILVISKQMRNKNINDAPDDISAFKHFITSQTNVADGVLNRGLAIINAEEDR